MYETVNTNANWFHYYIRKKEVLCLVTLVSLIYTIMGMVNVNHPSFSVSINSRNIFSTYQSI